MKGKDLPPCFSLWLPLKDNSPCSATCSRWILFSSVLGIQMQIFTSEKKRNSLVYWYNSTAGALRSWLPWPPKRNHARSIYLLCSLWKKPTPGLIRLQPYANEHEVTNDPPFFPLWRPAVPALPAQGPYQAAVGCLRSEEREVLQQLSVAPSQLSWGRSRWEGEILFITTSWQENRGGRNTSP